MFFDVMAQKLLQDYACLFYVNAATDEYIWYAKDPVAKTLIQQSPQVFMSTLPTMRCR